MGLVGAVGVFQEAAEYCHHQSKDVLWCFCFVCLFSLPP